MYVITFYSFKGGTGRSMALANVAADLLSKGRRVLIVDFDLEAPGLDTYPMVLDRPIDRGLVELITDYIASVGDNTPSVQDYVYQARFEGVSSGNLWIMPAGCQDASYDSRFKSIDWLDFYANQEGFLFFEDLKAQWESAYAPDYVLIDSRTGHTDIGGICTRQLPDSVVAMFLPNEQNLRGLAPVINDIRLELEGPRKKHIDLHFVVANLPDLDDEEEMLSEALRASQKKLKYKKIAATIHHFNSLLMLKQRILLVERPKSKISNEYQQLTLALIKSNLADREGVIHLLREALAALRADKDVTSDSTLEDRLQNILVLHSADAEILKRVARFRRAQRRTEESLALFDRVLEIDETDTTSLVGRAEIYIGIDRIDSALIDLANFFALSRSNGPNFVFATRLLVSANTGNLSKMLSSPSLSQLNYHAVREVMNVLLRRYDTVEDGITLLEQWSSGDSTHKRRRRISHELSLCLIAANRFEEAIEEIAKSDEPQDIYSLFNRAMAEWGVKLAPPVELLRKFLECLPDDIRGPNFLQCLAIANWALGESNEAIACLEKARVKLNSAPISTFSAWSYLYLPPKLFTEDLEAMRLAFQGEGISPRFIRRMYSLFDQESRDIVPL